MVKGFDLISEEVEYVCKKQFQEMIFDVLKMVFNSDFLCWRNKF